MTEKISKNSQERKPFSLRSESASSTVVGAVLLLAIIVSIFSVVRLGYIPEWKNDAEYSHMNDVWKDMSDLKSKIDLITIALASNPDSQDVEITMNVPFHMGGGDLPIIGTIKSSGTLSVNRDECEISITDPSGGLEETITCGAVSYSSQNRYYVDQDFRYEGGALILSQGERSSMMLYPSIRFSRTPANQYNASIHIVEIDKKTSSPTDVISSNTGCSLRLTGKKFETLYDSNNTNYFILTVNTDHPEAWELYLKETMKDSKISDYDLTLLPPNNIVSLTFPSESSGIDLDRLYVSKTVVKVEPGIGL
ncbi:MAG: hypothetical protein QM426_02440 [Euryarchaeota archaeon]|nr:hypothetical protein [Euryarchaeota archaeon]